MLALLQPHEKEMSFPTSKEKKLKPTRCTRTSYNENKKKGIGGGHPTPTDDLGGELAAILVFYPLLPPVPNGLAKELLEVCINNSEIGRHWLLMSSIARASSGDCTTFPSR